MSDWANAQKIIKRSYTCGFCGNNVAPSEGYKRTTTEHFILICPNCQKPTYFDPYDGQTPKSRKGSFSTCQYLTVPLF